MKLLSQYQCLRGYSLLTHATMFMEIPSKSWKKRNYLSLHDLLPLVAYIEGFSLKQA
jgi:hypothetical protein